MGVPTFFKWICTRYPKCIKDAVEKASIEVDGRDIPVDFEDPNPNGLEFDNFYLDMNGIIHPCCHPEDGMVPESEDQMYKMIMSYVDRLVRIIRPRKVLYLAIDGVAPRAKMNQQRARRYRAAQEALEQEKEESKLRNQFDKQGRSSPEVRGVWDSNVITPGTPFLDRISQLLHWYVADRMTHDPLWKLLGFRAILSDASVPGEGEHKIQDFIRRQRMQAAYNPNISHIIFGADADLIMLGLATHEMNFHIIREVIIQVEERRCYLCNKSGHLPSECTGEDAEAADDGEDLSVIEKPFQIISIPCLREYLTEQFAPFAAALPFEYDFERCVDDFVFICFFVGNDFLPHLPSLSIRDGSIDQMLTLYVEVLPTLGDYLTDAGSVNLMQVEVFLDYMGRIEDQVFKLRLQREDRLKSQRQQSRILPGHSAAPSRVIGKKRLAEDANLVQARKLLSSLTSQARFEASKRPRLLENLGAPAEVEDDEGLPPPALEPGQGGEFYDEVRSKLREKQDLGDRFPDKIRLGDGGDSAWKQRYYFEKFHVKQEDLPDFIARIRQAYIEGLCWVLLYYYQGVASWDWFYPYHYAPFASDLVGCSTLRCSQSSYFSRGAPFRPYEQLMAVLPPKSAKAAGLPSQLIDLMSDPESALIDFYPEDFALDLNGKKFLWQAVVLLPFIKEERLLSVLAPLIPADEERNQLGLPFLYVPAADPLAKQMVEAQKKWEAGEKARLQLQDLPFTDPRSQGNTLFGCIEGCSRGGIQDEVSCPLKGGLALQNPRCVVSLFEDAKPPHSRPLHSSQLLPGSYPPRKFLDGVDIAEASRLRGFGGEPAKRMILQLLQELGFHTQQHINKQLGPSELSGPPAAPPAGFSYRR